MKTASFIGVPELNLLPYNSIQSETSPRLSDLNSKIPVSIEPNGVQSILSGSGSSFGEIQYIKEDYELENDSEIFTSGSGGIFRSGIPIGKTIADENIGFDTIKVKFHSDFSQLRLVKIVSFEEVKQND